jgi:hypothetical protein
VKKVIGAVLGVVLVLGWWSFKSWFSGDSGGAVNGIPAKVWEGGGHNVTYTVNGSGAMRVSAWFSGRDAGKRQETRSLETWEKLDAGSKTYVIDAPRDSGATFDATIEAPKIGDTISITVSADGRVLCTDSQTLSEPIKPGYAFGVQCEIDDFASNQEGGVSDDE